MPGTFNLPIEFNGEETEYPAEIVHAGYTQKIKVTINGTPVTFEPDEEGCYRAVADADIVAVVPHLLLQEISETLKVLFG